MATGRSRSAILITPNWTSSWFAHRPGRNLGRPWATFLSDAFSRRLLAVCLTFDPPSYRSCMLALRECVRRYERLPEAIVVDGGPEFESVYFETLLARYGCTKKTRPGGRPRFGSVCERLFGTTNTRNHQYPEPRQGHQERQSKRAGLWDACCARYPSMRVGVRGLRHTRPSGPRPIAA